MDLSELNRISLENLLNINDYTLLELAIKKDNIEVLKQKIENAQKKTLPKWAQILSAISKGLITAVIPGSFIWVIIDIAANPCAIPMLVIMAFITVIFFPLFFIAAKNEYRNEQKQEKENARTKAFLEIRLELVQLLINQNKKQLINYVRKLSEKNINEKNTDYQKFKKRVLSIIEKNQQKWDVHNDEDCYQIALAFPHHQEIKPLDKIELSDVPSNAKKTQWLSPQNTLGVIHSAFVIDAILVGVYWLTCYLIPFFGGITIGLMLTSPIGIVIAATSGLALGIFFGFAEYTLRKKTRLIEKENQTLERKCDLKMQEYQKQENSIIFMKKMKTLLLKTTHIKKEKTSNIYRFFKTQKQGHMKKSFHQRLKRKRPGHITNKRHG